MKNKFFRALACLMAVVMVLSVAPLGSLAGVDFGVTASAASYKVGDKINFGNYPQTKVSDKNLIANLDKVAKKWKSYGYYSGTGDGSKDGKMQPSDYMKYADIKYGNTKYRAVYFTKYRPGTTGDVASASDNTGSIYYNGYRINTIYYFKYEPLKWRILDPKDGLIMCESIIDSQVYQNTFYDNGSDLYQNSTCKTYANDYATSSIRKWLIEDFYKTAFSSSQATNIKTTTLNNDAYFEPKCNSEPTRDKIFLLSHNEATNGKYGFDESDQCSPTRGAKGTDYAVCQGLIICHMGGLTDGNSIWWLRSPHYDSDYANGVDYSGHPSGCYPVYENGIGVRPACKLAVLKNDTALTETTKTTPITKCTITLKCATYTGKALKPTVAVKNGKTTLKSGTHYTVSYKNNTKIGKATVTIKGVEKNGYIGTKTLTFNILPGVTKSLKATQSTSAIKLAWSKVAGATGYRVYRHDGKKWVKLADTKNTTYTVSKLKAGTNYKYAVKAYTTVGKTVYWSTSYAQISTATKPATPTVKVSAGKKQAALSWNKVTGASGYVVYYSTSKNGTYKKLATVKGTSYTAKKLTTGKTYYFKVAAYKTVGKANIFGAYSTVKGVKVK